MKKTALLLVFCLVISGILMAQDDADNSPVRFPFETGILIDNHTYVTPFKGMLEYRIQHRFGPVTNGITDLFGIYAPSNIRMALNYGITDKLMVGIGSTKDYKLQDLQWKYAILQQTESGSMPVSLTYYGNMVIDARENEVFYPEENYRFIHRLSYFTQFIVGRKFNDVFTFQAAPALAYYNAVDTTYQNINVGLSLGGRAKILPQMSIIAEYGMPLYVSEESEAKPNLSLGVEIGTATHAFQIFLATYDQIVPQRNLVYNTNDFTEGDLLLGFNITARF